ncbi:MAG TPA: shikimate kinase, partial [Desulfotomaculum sp.]|nr:shikimate kinase [Desulfotomaculum sp.]
MGVGKSTIGRLLASRLGREFIDTDTRIEELAGKTIPQIFAREGEAHFRELESQLVKE